MIPWNVNVPTRPRPFHLAKTVVGAGLDGALGVPSTPSWPRLFQTRFTFGFAPLGGSFTAESPSPSGSAVTVAAFAPPTTAYIAKRVVPVGRDGGFSIRI